MLPSETLWPTTRPPAFERVGSTQPFNYRDTLTLLDYVNQVVEHIQSVQSDVDSDMSVIDDDLQTMQDTLAGMLLDMANLRDELIAMIKQAAASDNIMVWSPAYGNQVPAQLAVDDTYDANRIFGLFAGDFDDLAMSPADFDALQVSPREFDLRSTDAINAVRGDITRNDIWWLKEHGLTFGDLIAQAQQSATSAATSQTAAAQSATAAGKSATAAAQSATAAAQSATAAVQSATASSGVSGVRVILHRGEVMHESGIGYKTADGVLCYVTGAVGVSPGEEYVYTGSSSGGQSVFFYDSLMRNVGSVRTDNPNGEYVFTVPEGVSYMRAQSFAWTNSTSDVTLSLREKNGEAIRWLLDGRYATALNVGRVSDAVGGALSDMEGLMYGRGLLLGDETVLSPRYDEMTSGAFLNSSGGTKPIASGYTSDYVDLDTLGDTYITVRTMVAYQSRAAALYDRDHKFIRILGDNENTSGTKSVEFTVSLRECRMLGGTYIRFGFLGYITPDANKFQVVSTAPVALGDYIDSRNVASHASNVLYGKKYVICGDSFSAEIGSNNNHPYGKFIADRNNMAYVNLAIAGTTMSTDVASNNFCQYRYKKVPTDADYITLCYGLNEESRIPDHIGTKGSTELDTLWGAWNFSLEYLITNMPYAKIGIIIADAWTSQTMHDTLVGIAQWWGIPYLDLKDDPQVPMGLQGRLPPGSVSSKATELRQNAFAASDAHPNEQAHEYRSTIIENFLRTL